MKSKKKIVIIFCCIILFFCLAGRVLIAGLVNKVNKITVMNYNLSDTFDGKYVGEYSIIPVHVKVEVTIENHKFKSINILKHDNGLGGSAEIITHNIIESQSLDVDTISGATVSSKCILKAVENALENSKKGDLSK